VSDKLLEMSLAMKPKIGIRYIEAGLATLRREWKIIDRVRLDKFLSLARKLVQGLIR